MRYYVRKLSKNDLPEVLFLDRKSGYCVEDWIRYGFDTVWGIFCNNFMIGYCTMTDNRRYRNTNGEPHRQGMVLDNVFVLSSYRNSGAASFLLSEVLQKNEYIEKTVFVMLLHRELKEFYEKFGFLETEHPDIMRKPAGA